MHRKDLKSHRKIDLPANSSQTTGHSAPRTPSKAERRLEDESQSHGEAQLETIMNAFRIMADPSGLTTTMFTLLGQPVNTRSNTALN